MAILISPDIIYRAAARHVIVENTEKNAGAPGEEAHIYNLYEEFSMPLSDIIEIGRLGLEGKLENVQEKMDGQFLAFTVINGQLRFFTKMDLQGQAAKDKKLEAIQSGSKGGGMTLDEIMSTYTGGRSNIAEGFAIAYEALEPVAIGYQDSLFRNGEVVMASQIMVSKNPNTILYNNDSLRTVLAIPLTDGLVNQEALSLFTSEMKQASSEAFTMDKVPTANLIKGLKNDDSQIRQLEKDLSDVVQRAGLSIGNNTVGDYIKARLEKFISEKYSFIPSDLVPEVSNRFMTGKGKIALKIKNKVSPEEYKEFRSLDKSKSRIVQEAIIPLENIIQRLGVMIIDKLDLALTASNQKELLGFVKDARSALDSGFDFTLGEEDTKTLEGIRVALARLEENEDLFQKATEGIVFTYNNKTYKLTGLFTPINKLRGFFGNAMGREGFGKASLPSNDEKSLSESLNRIIMKILAEGGNAFKKKDSTGKNVVVTSEDRITREQATRIINDLKQNLLDPLNIKFLPAGSTGTDKLEIGDIDLIVSESDKETLYQSMLSAPYLSESLVEGVPRVLKLGQLIAIMVQDTQSGQLFQVDLFPSSNMDDTAWELSGGGEGKVKGEYHKLMLSLITKIKGEHESTQDNTIKYTLAFPGGLREKINGRENNDARVIDPDEYLPMIGINVPKSEIRTFESLVDHMDAEGTEEFLEAFERFEEYIENRLSSKSEKVRKAASDAIDYLSLRLAGKKGIKESYLKNIIERIIFEQEAEDSLDADEVENEEGIDLSSEKSFAGKARVIFKVLGSPDFFGSDLEKIIGVSASQNLIRLGLKTSSMEKYDFGTLMNKLYTKMLPNKSDNIVELAPDEMPNPSGTYPAYMMPEVENIIILFGSAGTSGGQRKAGYIYEDEVGERLSAAGIQVKPGSDNSYSDIYIPSANGTLGIEVKLPNAQAGEPTLRYDFDKGVWFASNPKPQNKDIADLINLDDTAPAVQKRMEMIRSAVNSFREKTGASPIESILGKVSKQEYTDIIQQVMRQSAEGTIKGSLLASYKISADVLRVYYMLKSAGLVQVKSKGLFHLHKDFKVTIVDENGNSKSTSLFQFPEAQGAVYFRNFRGNNYGIRAQLKNSPLRKLPNSKIDLDNESDIKEFVNVVKGTSFPIAKELAKSQSGTTVEIQEIFKIFESIENILK